MGVEGFHKLIYCHDCTTALSISYAGFLSCCATGLFLDAWPPLCVFTVGQQMFSWVSPVFWAIYSASSVGMKASTPTNNPWASWWRTMWALSSVLFELVAAADTYLIYQNMLAYIWIVKCLRNYNYVPEKLQEKNSLLSLTNVSNYLCIFLAALFNEAVQLCICINEEYPLLLYPIESSSVWITINLINDRLCSSFAHLLLNIPLS